MLGAIAHVGHSRAGGASKQSFGKCPLLPSQYYTPTPCKKKANQKTLQERIFKLLAERWGVELHRVKTDDWGSTVLCAAQAETASDPQEGGMNNAGRC